MVVPDSATSIGNYAFRDCSNLSSVAIGNGVTNVGPYAFENCVSVTNVILGSALTEMYWLPRFPSLAMLTVDLGSPLYSSLDGVLFNKGTNLLLLCPPGKAGSYTVPSVVTGIGDSAFSGCASLTEIILGNGTTNIGYAAFSGCTSLTNLAIPSTVLGIGRAFAGCSSLLAITVDPLNPAFSDLDGVLFNRSQTVLKAYPPGRIGHYTIPGSVFSI